MGYTRSTGASWSGTTDSMKGSSYEDLYKNRSGVAGSGKKKAYDPLEIKVRESRKSDVNPEPTPIIVALDGTGSMASVVRAGVIGLGTLFADLYTKRPVTDPHILAMVVGDVEAGDRAPLQATQFESDVIIVDQLKELYIEGGGGGNNFESYHLPLYFAATRVDADAFADGRRGFLFTIGDEEVPRSLTAAQIRTVFGPDEAIQNDLTYEELLAMVSPNWDVFHIMVEQGSYMRSRRDAVVDGWTKVLGQRAIPLTNIDDLAEVISGVIQVTHGADVDTVAGGYSGTTAVTVRKAVENLPSASTRTGADGVAAL